VKGSNGGFRHWQVFGLAISSVAASLSSPNVHTVDCASFQALKSQHSPLQVGFWDSCGIFPNVQVHQYNSSMIINEPYPQLCHKKKMAALVGGL